MKQFNKARLILNKISIKDETENGFTISKDENSLTFTADDNGYYSVDSNVFGESMLSETELISIILREDLLERINTK